MPADERDSGRRAAGNQLALGREPLPAALADKAFAAERRLAGFRLAVVGCNVVLYFAFIARRPDAVPMLANAIIAFAFAYGIYVLVAEPYRRYPVLMAGYFVSTADAVASLLWIDATGGVHSPFYLLLYVLAVGAAYRHRAGEAILATALFAGSYVGLLAFRGELAGNLPEVIPRVVYTFLAAGIGLFMAREIVEQAVGRLELASRARAEDARLRLAAIVDSSADAIVGLHPDGTVESWNARAGELFGWSFEEVGGKPAAILFSPGYWDLANDILQRVRGGEAVQQLDMMGVRKDGRAFTLALVASPIRDASGEVSGIALIGRDVTERHQHEGRLMVTERMASLGTLAAGIAHEVNNPLAYLTSNLEFVVARVRELEPSLPAGRAGALVQALTEAREGADRVRKVMNDLKTFSRPYDEASGPVDVRRVVESAVNIAWNGIQQRARLVKDWAEVF